MSVILTVSEAEHGVRLDVFLVRHVPGLSRASARRALGEGAVRLNGRVARRGGLALAAGDRVLAEPPASPRATPSSALVLVILYEDAELVVIDKPASVPSHPLATDEVGTVANALLARYPEMESVGYSRREPGLVHRLDNDTSGVLLAARDASTFEALRGALREGTVDKRYELLVEGRLDPGLEVIDAPIGAHPRDRRRVIAYLDEAPARARPARTEILEATSIGGTHTLVRVRAHVAVRHQLRAHFAAIGHPLVGDVRYGGALPEFGRHYLHAASLAFTLPRTEAAIHVESPRPPELERLLRALDHRSAGNRAGGE